MIFLPHHFHMWMWNATTHIYYCPVVGPVAGHSKDVEYLIQPNELSSWNQFEGWVNRAMISSPLVWIMRSHLPDFYWAVWSPTKWTYTIGASFATFLVREKHQHFYLKKRRERRENKCECYLEKWKRHAISIMFFLSWKISFTNYIINYRWKNNEIYR